MTNECIYSGIGKTTLTFMNVNCYHSFVDSATIFHGDLCFFYGLQNDCNIHYLIHHTTFPIRIMTMMCI